MFEGTTPKYHNSSIEGGTAKALPRFDLFNRIVAAAGYEMSICAKKKGKCIQVAFSE